MQEEESLFILQGQTITFLLQTDSKSAIFFLSFAMYLNMNLNWGWRVCVCVCVCRGRGGGVEI